MGLRPAALAVGLLVLATGCGSPTTGARAAQPDHRYGHASADDLRLTDGWATETPAAPAGAQDSGSMASTMSSVGGAYFTVTNDGDRDDALVAVSTPDAAQTQLHTTESEAGGTSGTMKQVARIPVPAGGTARLTVGGYHVMLVGPTRALSAGDRVPVRLRFASGTVLDVRLPVLDRADRPR